MIFFYFNFGIVIDMHNKYAGVFHAPLACWYWLFMIKAIIFVVGTVVLVVRVVVKMEFKK